MRIPFWFLLAGAVVALAAVLLIGLTVLDPNTPLIANAGFEFATITPNADGDRDISPFNYTLARPAQVSLYFEDAGGQRFELRTRQDRLSGDHGFLFSGVVDGFTLPGETPAADNVIERRLLPDGVYTWTLTANGTQRQETETRTGTLTIEEGDPVLPTLLSFALSSPVFTPNQDGVRDRVGISVAVPKVAEVKAYLINSDGERFSIAARESIREDDEGFRHEFDYEGGVDINADPPPDGTYTILVEAQDAVGQRLSRTAELTIRSGGKPYAEIVGQVIGPEVVFVVQPYDERYFTSADVTGDRIAPPDDSLDENFNTIPVPVGDLLVFKLVVENYGASPIRTSGPPPGTVYQQTQIYASLGETSYQQSGVWRVGIQCDTSSESYPWRWALGDASTLEAVEDPASGNTYLYLPPGERVEVWGAIRMTELVPTYNPQTCYAGLIHEGVAISVQNMVVGARSILLQSSEQTQAFNTGDPTEIPTVIATVTQP